MARRPAATPEPHPIDDRVDADTEPASSRLDELDPRVIPALVADAVSHYDVPLRLTHVIIDRFLPVRPAGARPGVRPARPTPAAGAAYASYTTDGTSRRPAAPMRQSSPGLELVLELLDRHEHGAGLRALGRTDDAPLLEQVHQAAGPGEARP